MGTLGALENDDSLSRGCLRKVGWILGLSLRAWTFLESWGSSEVRRPSDYWDLGGGGAEVSPSQWKVSRTVRWSFRSLEDLEDGLAGSPGVCSKMELFFLFFVFEALIFTMEFLFFWKVFLGP